MNDSNWECRNEITIVPLHHLEPYIIILSFKTKPLSMRRIPLRTKPEAASVSNAYKNVTKTPIKKTTRLALCT